MELVKSSTTHFTVTPLEFVRNQKIEINGDKINGGVENVKDVNEKGKDLSVRWKIGPFLLTYVSDKIISVKDLNLKSLVTN